MKRVLLLTGAALALAACSRGEATETTIETAAVERRDIVVDAQATGVVEPIFVVEVKSKSSGQIIEMPVDVGSEVKPGDLLVQLDTRDVKNQYDQAAADLAAAQARLEVAKSQRDRSKNLYDAQIITRQEFETSGLEYENARAQIIRTETTLDIARQRLEEGTVRAPVVGTIIEKPVSIGQVIASASTSASGGTTILKMADLSKVRVRALVNETDIGQIAAGQPARVVVDAFPNQPFFGTVEKVEPQAVVQQSVTMFPVLVSLSNEAGLLKPGMNGEVSVEISRRENVLAVPNDAIRTMRELQTTAAALGLDPDSAQAALRNQFGNRGGPPQAGGPGGDTGGAARVGRGDVALDQPPQGGQRGPGGLAMPQVTDAQCAEVDAAFAKQPAARARLDSLRAQMRSGAIQREQMMQESQRVYGTVGVDARVAGACMRRGQQGGPNGGQPGQGAPGGAAPAQRAPGQGGPAQGGQAGAEGRTFFQGQAGGMGGGMGGRGGRTGLVFVAKNGTYEPRMVRLGASDFDYTEVLSGVEEGESVALLAVVAMQAERDERNEQMRSRMGGPIPGMGGGGQRPAGGGGAGQRPAGGGGPAGGGAARPPAGGGPGGGGGR